MTYNTASTKKLLCPGLVVLAYCCIAASTFQSRGQYAPIYDLLPDTANARAFLQKGEIPTHGSVSSFYSFNPPGVSWGLIPGLLVFPRDPVAAQQMSCFLLLALTLAGLYLLVAGRYGELAAVAACLVYMLSDRGFFFAGSLRPRAHPVFLVWFVYFVDRWVRRDEPRDLAWAVAIWLAGAYWMLEGVTAILVVPLAWVFFRPPVRWRSACLAILAGTLIWSPYLVLEAKRGFLDLRAILTRTSTLADFDSGFRSVLSNPGLKTVEGRRPHAITGGPQQPDQTGKADTPTYRWLYDERHEWVLQAVEETVQGGVRGRWTFIKSRGGWIFVGRAGPGSLLAHKAGKVWSLIVVSMPETRIPGGAALLVFLFGSSVLWGFSGISREWTAERRLWMRRAPTWGIVLLLTAGAVPVLLHGPGALDLTPADGLSLEVVCGLSILALLATSFGAARRFLPMVFAERADHTGGLPATRKFHAALPFLLAATASIPWVITIFLEVNDDGQDLVRRFLWLWIVQGALVVLYLQNLRGRTIVRICAWSCLVLLVLFNDNGARTLQTWRENGLHSAPPNDFYNVVDFLGERIKAERRASAAIGYDVPFMKWMVANRAVDGVCKVGSQYDEVFSMRYGITNLDTTAEGVAPNDEFRIVEHSDIGWQGTYFDLSAYPTMTPIYKSATYTVLERKK